MFDEIKFQIDELIAQYILHPDFRDIFTEGVRDKNFYKWFLYETNVDKEVNCYEIGCVNIPSKILKEYNLSAGCEKNKVIAFALELSKKLPKDSKTVTCIVEVDFDYLFETKIDCNLLFYTDYACLEMYTFRYDVLKKFINVGIGGFPIEPDKIIEQLTPILVDLFLVRASNICLNLGMHWLTIKSRRCRIDKNGDLKFDIESFVKDYLQQNNRGSEKNKFWKKFNELKQRVSGDKRRFIRGHDYVNLFGIYLYKLRRRLKHWKEEPDDLSGTLLLCLNIDEIRKERLFASIISRIV